MISQGQYIPIPLTRSISFQLAKKGFIAAMLMAIILGISQATWSYYLQQQINANTIDEILYAIQESSTQVLSNKDTNLARIVLGGLIKKDFIIGATIFNADQSVFLSIKNSSEKKSPYRFITRIISKEFIQKNIHLIHNNSQCIGTLELTVDHHVMLAPLYKRAIISIFLSTILILVVCVIMFAVFQRNITNPLALIIQSIRSINPREINNAQLNPLHGHEHDELGMLINISNEFIQSNSYHIEERITAEKKLRALNEELEQRVKERTDRLYQKIIQYEKAENQLRMYERIVASTSDMIGLIDRDYQYILLNASYEVAFGKKQSELIGKNIESLFGIEMKEQLEPRLERCFNGETIVFETWYRYPAIGDRYMSVHYTPWVQDDFIEHVVVSGRDITRLKRAEEQLNLAIAEAEDANRAKSEFLARMSHEIRTPLNAIIGLTHLIIQTQLSNKQYEYLNKIISSSQSLLSVINDILDFSKIEAGKLTIEHVNFNLDDVLEKISSVLSIKAHQKGLELIFEISPHVPNSLFGDPLRLGQVLTNLTNNAIKFTDHGEVIIRIQSHKSDVSDKVVLEFSVIDTGIGISQTQLDKLFKSFSQADPYITRKYGGTGLGLSICKGLIEIMGGSIDVKSTFGKGSTFSFRCPFDVQSLQKVPEHNKNETSDIHILLVDDNKASRMVFKSTLLSFSFRVTEAGSGQEALKILLSNHNDPFSLLLVDWKMPGMDGIEFIRRIRTISNCREIPSILMVTSFRDDSFLNDVKSVGIDTVLSKPIKPSALLDSIMSSLNKTELHAIIESKIEPQFKDRYQLSGNVLLVEDNNINQEVAEELLRYCGFNVQIANNGQQALDIYTRQSSNFDAILMDIQMPIMDGYEATKQIRKHESALSLQSVPIIAMTAHAMIGEKERCLSAGMNDYNTKPINPDILIQTLCRWIPHLKNKKHQTVIIDKNFNRSIKTSYSGLNIADGLARVSNQEDIYLAILKTFIRDFADCPNQIITLYENRLYEQLKRTVHNLKGVSGNIGARLVYENCCLIEKSFQNNHFQNIQKELDILAVNLTDTINAIQTILKSESKFIGNEDSDDNTIEMNLEDIQNLLQDFDQLLQQHHLDAEAALKKLIHAMRRKNDMVDLSIIADYMARYDYVAAHNHLMIIKDRIQEVFDDTGRRQKEDIDR
jgi:PAS domain S-box-containing protein